ncbi:ribonuclease T2 [Pogona vitticeps]|nr:ribonuclease T2 [Pogona vitticeps]XP_020664209.1 ribonuclease T2 [Pogona vitticeps]XP_020664218.1 ribonuclease T2 [Pogona vitticeps]
MKSITQCCLLAGCICLAVLCGTATYALTSSDHPHKWEKLYLVLEWPVTICKMSENDCRDPLMYWTIHGLWPDKADECNRTWHFNISEIKDILGDMEHYWPDVLHPNRTKFWKHEWEKHGTCAAVLESLNSQKKYFSKALELYKEIDLNSYLVKLRIKPGGTYQMAAIREALTSVYQVTPKIQCLPPDEGQLQVIGQIKFCLTKEFALINCTESKSGSSFAHENNLFKTEDLSKCSDTLTDYPSHLRTWEHFLANTVDIQ